MRCYSHHQPSMTLLGWGQKQIQVSMGGGRDQHFVSSVSAQRPRGSMEGTICGCISFREGSQKAGSLPRRTGMAPWHIPQPCSACPPASFQQCWAALSLRGSPWICTAVVTRFLSPIRFTFNPSFPQYLRRNCDNVFIYISFLFSCFFFFFNVIPIFYPSFLSS